MNAVVILDEDSERLLPAIQVIDLARQPTLDLVPGEIAAGAFTYNDFGNQAIVQAERAVITDDASFGLGGDLMKAINSNLKSLEERRKRYTSPVDTLKAYIADLYKPGKTKLERARDIVQGKLNEWARAEAARKAVEAAARQRQIEAAALAMAETQQAMGDSGGADQILDDASKMSERTLADAKVIGRGAYGSTSSQQGRWVGAVTSPRAFVHWLAETRPTAILDTLEFKQSGLNKLAKEIGELQERDKAHSIEIPGMKIEREVNVRSR